MGTATPPEPEATPGVLANRDDWRREYARLLGWVILVLGAVAVALMLLGPGPLQAPQVAMVATVLVGQIAAISRASVETRGTVFILCLLALTAVVTATGFGPNLAAMALAAVVSAAILKGLEASLMTLGAAVALVFLGTTLISRGLVPEPSQWRTLFDPRDPLVVARIALVLTGLGATIAFGVSRSLENAHRSIVERDRALAALAEESRRREAVQDELVQREAALARAQELELLGRLASYAAHDFNNALLVLMMELDELRLRPGEPPPPGSLDAMLDATRAAAATARQLRGFGPGAEGAPVVLEVDRFLARTLRLLSRILPEPIRVKHEAGTPGLRILADEGSLQQVLTNLALNARDAMPRGGTLTLATRPPTPEEAARTPGAAVIEVRDTGVGMDAATLARVFDPFFTTKGASGTGLGLASARALVERAGGWLTMASEVGVGTSVRLGWPGAETRAAEPGREARDLPRLETVLVVDDDQAVREAVIQALTHHVDSTLTAGGVAEALERLRRCHGRVPLLVTDWELPGPPVEELIAEFRRLQPGGRVLVCSGAPPAAFAGVAVDAHLAKPFDADGLAAAVRQALGP